MSPSVLLKGAWYALEHAGSLLRAAAALYRAKVYSSAVVLALFSREELGKHRILLDLWRAAEHDGRLPLVSEVRTAYKDHIEKQRRGQLSLLVDANSPTDEAATRAAVERAAKGRHYRRQGVLYTGLNSAGTNWYQPARLAGPDSWAEIGHAILDYARASEAGLSVLVESDPRFRAALEAWTDRPPLPAPPEPGLDMGLWNQPNERDEKGDRLVIDFASEVRFENLVEDIFKAISRRIRTDASTPRETINALTDVLAWAIWRASEDEADHEHYLNVVQILANGALKAYRNGRRMPDRPGGPVVLGQNSGL